VASCAKHFPGHGDTHVDSHHALPTIKKSRELLEKTELVPFRELISDDIPTIMLGHMALPGLTGDEVPASLSHVATTDLLRSELGYHGVIVTDCLEMEAVASTYGSETGAVRALQAGADIAMICHRLDRQRGAVAKAQAAVRDGELSVDALRASGARIAALKERFAGTWEEVLETPFDVKAAHALKATNAELSRYAYSMSTALLPSTRTSPLPLRRDARLVLFAPRTTRINPAVDDPTGLENVLGPGYMAFATAMASRTGQNAIDIVAYGPDGVDQHPPMDDAVVVFVTRDAHVHKWQLDALKHVADTMRRMTSAGVVLVSTCAPYDLPQTCALVPDGVPCACIATFEFTPPALEAATAVIFGERKATGCIPVTLDWVRHASAVS
jgi:beta-N-acetylhexosaminidase